MKHYLNPRLLQAPIQIALVGAGGSGSQMLDYLARLHRALLALGHPGGLDVTVIDADKVSYANVGRQAYYPTDVHTYKSVTLVNRANMALGTRWKAAVGRVTTDSTGLAKFDMVIGAVDNRSARLGILRSLEHTMSGTRYWLDMGNRADDGQVVLGEVPSNRTVKDKVDRLPHAGELFPELIDAELDKHEDDVPSCSLAEALEKQSLFINPSMAMVAGNLLWQLFTKGELSVHGAFVNLRDFRQTPLEISHETWARFGVVRDGKRHKVMQPSRKRKGASKVSPTP